MCVCLPTGVTGAAESLGNSSTQRLSRVHAELEGAVRSAEASAKRQQVCVGGEVREQLQRNMAFCVTSMPFFLFHTDLCLC